MPGAADLYMQSRRALLDALEALEQHRDAIVLVGAQAVVDSRSMNIASLEDGDRRSYLIAGAEAFSR